ncbi:DUF5317 family protein [Actinoplanes nipponensis]|uniref:DUF5317 family protein n=1 Tax=Actinoplanes nipponensis TaxID=135950 RepID=UPI0031EB3485
MSLPSLLLTTAPPAAGVVLGRLLGGRLTGLRILATRALWLLWLAAAVQFAQFSLPAVRHAAEQVLGVPLLAVVFLLVLAWLGAGLAGWPAALRAAAAVIMLGAALNGLAIALNGRMPYAPAAARAAGLPAGVVTAKNEPAHAPHPGRRPRRHHRGPAAAGGHQPRRHPDRRRRLRAGRPGDAPAPTGRCRAPIRGGGGES